jgi:hypothetical protein
MRSDGATDLVEKCNKARKQPHLWIKYAILNIQHHTKKSLICLLSRDSLNNNSNLSLNRVELSRSNNAFIAYRAKRIVRF